MALAGTTALPAHADRPAQVDTTTSTATAPVSTDDRLVPDGFVTLFDDTDRITVAVPETWTDVDTTPAFVDGAEVPSIHAATNRDVWRDTFDAPGVWFAAFPYAQDPQAIYDRYALTSGCRDRDILPYFDGAYSGLWWQYTNCGSTGSAEWHAVVASPATQDFTALVVMQFTDAGDIHAFSVVRETFNMTPTATWPSGSTQPATSEPATPDSTPALPTEPGPPSTPEPTTSSTGS